MNYPDFSFLNTKLTCKDYTVSEEYFQLKYWDEYDMLVTYPQPKLDELDSYYESEDYISHTDSKATLVDKIYQSVKRIMLNKKLEIVSSFNQNKGSLLDVGAGTGDFLNAAKNDGWSISGVEPNSKARSLANQKSISLVEDINQLPTQKYDVITLWHVLEHVPNLFEYIETLKSLLKENGILIIAVPNYKSYDATYYKEFWAAYDVPRHLWHFSPKGIKKLFAQFNFKLENTHPMTYDAYYVSLLSEKYKNSSFQKLKALKTGFLSNLKAKHSGEYSSLIYCFKTI
ncbi:class I SAM-dependent methyltransferase [Croceibacter atlanticus]|mgnify:FL=1|uniref:class I SAM-dependent methyltransferase n=1 Tax=Croceibacter atlanticus TaxID=313588 RepID=UPI0030FC8ADC